MYVLYQRMLSVKITLHQQIMDQSKNGWGVWCNPPYGKDIEAWVKKASYEIKQDYCNFIVMLIPARTDTKWFHNYVLPYSKIFYIKGRIKFGSNKGSAPFPSLLAIYFKEFR